MSFALMAKDESDDDKNQAFLRLFEGCDVMQAPPWGSVYLDKDQVVFGDSTVAYRQFLKQEQIELDTGMREPEDQFGLMLMAISQLVEKQSGIEAIKTLLEEHCLPWAYRYLELVETYSAIESYKQLSAVTRDWLNELQQELSLSPVEMKLYR